MLLSTLHQSSLGSLYLIVPHKLHPLWYTPLLPVFFFFSAIMVGLAMTIFESWHSSKAFGRQLELPLLQGLARVLAVLLAAYLAMRFLDLVRRGALCTSVGAGHGELSVRAGDLLAAVAHAAAVPAARAGQSKGAILMRCAGDPRLHHQSSEHQHHGHGSRLRHAVHSEVDRSRQ